MSPVSTWFEFPSPFTTAPGSLLLADPPVSNMRKLRTMLLDESYPKPFVIDDGDLLTLYFNIRLIQSAMRLDSPDALALRYTQTMMSFLLFNPHPDRIVQIGLGGGSLAKFCFHRLPGSHVTVLEINPDVIAFRDMFKLPPDGPRLKVLQQDGAEYLARAKAGIDVLLIDAFDQTGFAPELASRDFFETVFDKLSNAGQLVMNLAGDKRRYRGLLDEVMEVFDGRMVTVPVRGDGNSILMAVKNASFRPAWRRLETQAQKLKEQHGLGFPHYLDKIERAWKNR